MTTQGHDAMTPDALEPGDAAVEQEEAPPLGALPVTVETPVRVQELPARAAGYRRVAVGTTEPLRVLGRDPRRRRAVIQVYDAAGATHGVYLGASRTEVAPPASFAARLGVATPGGGTPVASHPLELRGLDELWLLADTAGCEVTVIAEQWAD